MLYTFSQAHDSETELQRYLTETTENDAVVLWQDGVLLAVKYGEMFTQCKGQCFVLEQRCFSPKFNRTFARKTIEVRSNSINRI